MLIGRIRPVETTTVEVRGGSLADLHAKLGEQAPHGFDLLSAPARMLKGSQDIEATGTFARRDESTEIEADDMAALRAKVPEGWELLSVRRV
ncbi:hypothetical protein [Microbacterium sp.]|uniref:hypothetical protein n=1 Tax=Microbacterium sp. TaxID=51671 RepID=UPI0028121A62|nr:hypothetical protein [Microbacterium sp.]